MSSYLSNLLTQTTSRYNSLRRSLLSSEDDGDTEDDTHICRVLRAYYTEKGHSFPPWLPPDPNDKPVATPQPNRQQSGYFSSSSGKSQYAAVQNQGVQRAGLSDLWDPPSQSQSSVAMQPQSLRNARRPTNTPAQGSGSSLEPAQARPLPSQRAGSYQSATSQQTNSRPDSGLSHQPSQSSGSGAAGAGSAQERLKARLWGAGAGRPGQMPPSPGPMQTTAPNISNQTTMGSNAPRGDVGNPYENGGAGGRRYGR